VFNEPLETIIGDFVKAGTRLDSRRRRGNSGGSRAPRIAPLKAMSDDWLEVMDVAHRLGLYSSATMMFGHVETMEDRIEHLERLRAQQDKSKMGFTAFIAWTFQAEHTKLKAPTVGAHEYLRMQALARIYLDNFQNIQSSWVTQGLEIGQVALKYGANDLGSIMIEENVVSQAGTTFRMTVPDMHRLIKDLGYEPHQRDNWYQLVN
jgi:cyclic dehypoxanthinyl futalosine synthase